MMEIKLKISKFHVRKKKLILNQKLKNIEIKNMNMIFGTNEKKKVTMFKLASYTSGIH